MARIHALRAAGIPLPERSPRIIHPDRHTGRTDQILFMPGQAHSMDPAVPATFVVVAALEIAIPLLLGYYVVRRFRLPWAAFFFGALFFIISQAIHIPLLMLLQPPFIGWAEAVFTGPAALLAAAGIFLGTFAGILEEGIRYLAISRVFPARRLPVTRETALLFGTGWGGIESIAIAGAVLLSMVSYLIAGSGGAGLLANLSDPAQAARVEALLAVAPADILAGLFERCMTVILHIAFTFLVLLAVLRSRPVFLAAAILYHAFVDFTAVFLAGSYGIWPAEAAVAGLAATGVVVIAIGWRSAGLQEREHPGADLPA